MQFQITKNNYSLLKKQIINNYRAQNKLQDHFTFISISDNLTELLNLYN